MTLFFSWKDSMSIKCYFEKIKLRKHSLRRALYAVSMRKNKLYKEEFLKTNSIFVHIPKSAGRAVAMTLYGRSDIGHYYARDYYFCDRNLYMKSYTFSFVRDPLDRIYSAYSYLINGGGNSLDARVGKVLARETSGFNDFILNWLTQEKMYYWFHFVPQFEYLYLNDRLMVDYVGRMENINKDFQHISERIVGQSLKLKKINIGSREKDWVNKVSEEAKRKVLYLYREDYRRFGYDENIIC